MVETVTQTQLDTGRIALKEIIVLDLGSGVYGFNSDISQWTWTGSPFGTLVTVGAGSLIEVTAIQSTPEIEENGFTVTMRAEPESGVTPDVLESIETDIYHRRPIYFYVAYFNPDTHALLSVELFWRGLIDQIAFTDSPETFQMDIRCVSRHRDIRGAQHRVRTDADQRLIDASDNGLRHVAFIAHEEIEFGTGTTEKQGFFQKAKARREARRAKRTARRGTN